MWQWQEPCYLFPDVRGSYKKSGKLKFDCKFNGSSVESWSWTTVIFTLCWIRNPISLVFSILSGDFLRQSLPHNNYTWNRRWTRAYKYITGPGLKGSCLNKFFLLHSQHNLHSYLLLLLPFVRPGSTPPGRLARLLLTGLRSSNE